MLRDSQGAPWFVGDGLLHDPDMPKTSPDQTVWIMLDFDREGLRQHKRIGPEWLDRVAMSTIEIGIARNKEIVVAAPGDVPLDVALTPLHSIAKVTLFED